MAGSGSVGEKTSWNCRTSWGLQSSILDLAGRPAFYQFPITVTVNLLSSLVVGKTLCECEGMGWPFEIEARTKWTRQKGIEIASDWVGRNTEPED